MCGGMMTGKRVRRNFKNGKRDGVFTDWHDNGQSLLLTWYKKWAEEGRK